MVLLQTLGLCLSNYLFGSGFKPIQDDFQHVFARMTNEAGSSVVPAEMWVDLFRDCNYHCVSPWGKLAEM